MRKIDLEFFGAEGAVYPVHNNKFYVAITGGFSGTPDTIIRGLDGFKPAIEAKTETWSPMDLEGWDRNSVTGKALKIAFSGKRQYGDTGNDYIASLMLATGVSVESKFKWELPTGATLTFNCVISVTTPAGGETTNIDAIEFEVLCDGKPKYAAATAFKELTFVCTDSITAGATKIAAVSPIIGADHSYFYKINGGLPLYNESIVGLGWAAYTLGSDILTSVGNNISLVEVITANKLVVGGGTSPAVIS